MKTLTVANLEQKIIFFCEMKVQIEYGYWEECSGGDDWIDLKWSDVIVGSDIGTVDIPEQAKRNYNFSSRLLLEAVEQRLRTIIVMTKNDPGLIPQIAIASGNSVKMIEIVNFIYSNATENVINSMDDIYSYTDLRNDCKGLKDSFRKSKEN